LHVFAPPTLAPLHLDMLRRLSRWIDIDLYAQNPSREYWFDVVDRKRLSWLRARGEAAHHETGNTLLASWGRQTQQFVDLLFDDAGPVEDDSEFVAANQPRLLALVQNAVLDLVELPRGSVPPAADDRSVEVHVCHSLTREIEVLHDRLLGLFAGDDSLRPADILVVTPDLVSAAPLIDAVFGTAPRERHVPYAITGLPAARSNSAAVALLSVLDLATSRVTATGVVDVLQQPLVARRFALDEAGLEIVRRWIRDAGIRWGLDAAHRAEFDVPATAEHTFADGLDRLFLGYALPAADTLFAGQLPAGDAEGTDAAALGGLYAFIREIGRLHARASAPKSIGRWRDVLADAVAAFFRAAGQRSRRIARRRCCNRPVCNDIVRGGAVESLPFAVVRAALEPAFDDPARGGVPSGSVTFAPMASLRGLPYRVVCAIGNERSRVADRPAPDRVRPDGRCARARRSPAPDRRAQRIPRSRACGAR
jgi:exodeoxyribonuclease V gamma subunit